MNFKVNWDALGIATSVACAIHCAILPLVLSSLPLFGINILNNEMFEYLMILIALMIGVWSLWHGFKKHHHSFLPITIFVVGIITLVFKQVWHQWSIYFLIPAVLFIISAHWLNYKKCRVHDHAHSEDCSH